MSELLYRYSGKQSAVVLTSAPDGLGEVVERYFEVCLKQYWANADNKDVRFPD